MESVDFVASSCSINAVSKENPSCFGQSSRPLWRGGAIVCTKGVLRSTRTGGLWVLYLVYVPYNSSQRRRVVVVRWIARFASLAPILEHWWSCLWKAWHILLCIKRQKGHIVNCRANFREIDLDLHVEEFLHRYMYDVDLDLWEENLKKGIAEEWPSF